MNDRTDLPPEYVPSWDSEEWTVQVSTVSTHFHVYPLKGLMSLRNWSTLENLALFVRREYPRTEKQLRKSVAACQRLCDRMNEKERVARETLARFNGEAE